MRFCRSPGGRRVLLYGATSVPNVNPTSLHSLFITDCQRRRFQCLHVYMVITWVVPFPLFSCTFVFSLATFLQLQFEFSISSHHYEWAQCSGFNQPENTSTEQSRTRKSYPRARWYKGCSSLTTGFAWLVRYNRRIQRLSIARLAMRGMSWCPIMPHLPDVLSLFVCCSHWGFHVKLDNIRLSRQREGNKSVRVK